MIEVRNITKHYGSVKAVEDISFDVNTGELFGFIGPDGSGKTTLFRILSTLILADSGSATLDGLDVVRDFKKIRKMIGYMPGRFSLYLDLTVEENLNFYATIFGSTLKKNYDLIRDIYSQIEPFRKRKAGKLSGGMKQKLALSCALIHKPRILILDEPTTGVDAVSRTEFWEMLKRLKESGITIIVSTPYMDEAGLCDRVALIQNGKILQINRPGEVVAAFPFPLYSVKSDDIYRLIEEMKGLAGVRSAYAFGQVVHLALEKERAEPGWIREALVRSGHRDIEIKKIRASIEDCFMELMAS
ncbi:MAG TPA: ABC transporter ATP-binding protein [Bacteroidales bacterium]|nr:ABC transporter ATP-binding protein [Bacteroidales bacterium]